MRIEAYNQVASLYQANQVKKTQATDKTVASARDEVQISSVGKDYQVAKKAVNEAGDIREDRVAEVKAKMKSGEYSVNVEDFAKKLYDALKEV
ncbi:MAG: flagellar biosynthesis anti-sigma factor FlgM [Pseudobutyrivibrio sp.]|nr:flagellar biosynthesis anti-sigma factor FlgM [Pseudobutyrivibrio sp.]